MDMMRRQLLRMVGIGSVAIAIPRLAWSSEPGSGAAFKLAMGPMSAAQKNQHQAPTISDDAVRKCDPATCPKPHRRAKHWRRKSKRSKTAR